MNRPLRAVVFGPKRHAEFRRDAGALQIVDRTDANLGGTCVDHPAMPGRSEDGLRTWSLASVENDVRFAVKRQGDPKALRSRPSWYAGEGELFPLLRRRIVTTPEFAKTLPVVLRPRIGTRFIEAQSDLYEEIKPVALDPGGDLADWRSLHWYDRRTGQRLRVTTDWEDPDRIVLVRLGDFAARWSRPRLPKPIVEVVIDPLLVRHVGRVSGMIDAELDGLPGDLRARRPCYDDAERLAAVQHIAASIGPRKFARRSRLPLKVAERAALDKPISKVNVRKALRALGRNGDERRCGLEGCPRLVPRPNAVYCSDAHADRAYRLRKKVAS